MTRKKLRYDDQARAVLASLGVTHQGNALRFDGAHADAGESLFILQELQAIEQRLYETPFGPRKSEILIPHVNDVPAGAQEWGYDRVTPYGIAQWISADAKDIPLANVDRKRVTFPVKSMGMGYSYTREALMAALMANMPLETMEAMACRRGIDSFRDQVLLQGDASVGYTGFLNDPGVSISSLAHGAWDGTAATPDQIIAEVNAKVFLVGQTCKEVYWPDTLVVPPKVYSFLTTAPRSANSDTTIWQYIQKNNPTLKNLEMLLQLAPSSEPGGIGPGVGGVSRAVLYKRDPECLVAKIALLFEQLPPQMKGFSIEVPCWARIAGTHFRVPISALYMDGV